MASVDHQLTDPAPIPEERMFPTLWQRPLGGEPAFRFIDLFAGIGGLRLGLEQAGGQCAYSVEIDRHAQVTYAANFGPIDEADVRAVDPATLPAYGVLAAGFPCQPFSIAGVSKKASLGREHGFVDEKSGTLFFEIVRSPKPRSRRSFSLRTSRTCARTTADVRSSHLGRARRLGYEVSHSLVDAASWVPQHRERIFIVGLRREVFGGRGSNFPRYQRLVGLSSATASILVGRSVSTS